MNRVDPQLPFRWTLRTLLPCVLSVSIVVASPTDSGADETVGELRYKALNALQAGDNEAAVRAANTLVKQQPDDASVMRLAGDILLRAGDPKTAAKLFDDFIKVHPDQMPGLWQRGIALYFIGDFKRGAAQFEAHRAGNPNDVENAAWHYLCIAKASSPERAKEMLLPAPGDPRPPMKEVLQMLGTGDTEAVHARVRSLAENTPERFYAAFFGDLYLGLYADANGDLDEARRLLQRCAKNAPRNYMGDVARVYAKHLSK